MATARTIQISSRLTLAIYPSSSGHGRRYDLTEDDDLTITSVLLTEEEASQVSVAIAQDLANIRGASKSPSPI